MRAIYWKARRLPNTDMAFWQLHAEQGATLEMAFRAQAALARGTASNNRLVERALGHKHIHRAEI